MKKQTILYCAASILFFGLFVSQKSFAQYSRTGYFIENYSYRHMTNPALSPLRAYVGFPALGNFGLSAETNMSLSTFLYQLPSDQLGLFLHPDVSAKTFASNLKNKNYMDISNSIDILSFGFYAGQSGGFYSFDLNIKTYGQINIPKDFFLFAKEGMSSSHTQYDMSGMEMGLNSYVELALGYAQDIGEEWRVGGKLKIISGLARMQVDMNSLQLTLSEDQWKIHSQAQAAIMSKNISFTTDTNGTISGFELNGINPTGFGLGLDLGMEYRFKDDSPLKGFRVSAAFTDIGFITYAKGSVQYAEANGTFDYQGFTNIGIGDSMKITGIDGQMEALKDEILSLAQLKETNKNKALTTSLRTNMNIGFEYAFLQNKLSAGILSTTRFGLPKTTTELTLSFNARPQKWIGISLSYSFLHSHWSSLGWALSINPKWGLSLFLASDYTFYRVASPYIPVNTGTFNFFAGINIPIGNNYNKNRDKVNPTQISIPAFIQTPQTESTENL